MKILTVEEALKEISAKPGKNGKITPNRFSKKNFNLLLTALANDVDFKEKVVKKAGDDSVELEDIMVTKDFRKWIKKIVEKLGVDSKDADVVLTSDFKIDNVDGLYDFFASAVYEYMLAGNRFDIPAHEDFKGSIYLKDIDASSKTGTARNPMTGEILGNYETKKKKHKELGVKSSCPKYLTEKLKK